MSSFRVHALPGAYLERVRGRLADDLFAAHAQHLPVHDGSGALWASGRAPEVPSFPFDSPAARGAALEYRPANLRRRGIFLAPREPGVR